jgi:hypothetical protein
LNTLLACRAWSLLIAHGRVAPETNSVEPKSQNALAAQRRAAGHKSREPGQHFQELVRRAMARLAMPGTKNVWALLLTPDIVKQLAARPPVLPIGSVSS